MTTRIVIICIFVLSLILRIYHLDNRTPFDWDQNRDYAQVQKIERGAYIPLGPVAKGAGGFHLGSLYYYLLYPGYVLLHKNLSALPLTSVLLDTIAVSCVYMLLRKQLGNRHACALSLICATNWMMIEAAHISWNVALVPLWSVVTLYTLTKVVTDHTRPHLLLLAFLAGLTIHIHVATIPLIPLLTILFFRKFTFSLRDWVLALGIGMIPAIPLIMYDLMHHFANYHLLRDQIAYQNAFKVDVIPMLKMTILKLGKVTSGLLLAQFRDNLILGIATVGIAIAALFSSRPIIKIAGVSVLISVTLVLLLHDYGFPEYYFAPSYLAILLVYLDLIYRLVKSRLTILCCLVVIGCNLRQYTTTSTGYSLSVKKQIIETLATYPDPIDLHYAFDPGREGGLAYLATLKGIRLDPRAKTRILLTDKLNTPLYIEGELTHDLTQIAGIKSARYIVQ